MPRSKPKKVLLPHSLKAAGHPKQTTDDTFQTQDYLLFAHKIRPDLSSMPGSSPRTVSDSLDCISGGPLRSPQVGFSSHYWQEYL